MNIYTISDFFASIFPGKVQKIAVNAGLGCPNRDGRISKGGCTYCNNSSFSPSYTAGSISSQIEKGKQFFRKKHIPWGYLAYFQSFSGTYGKTEKLIELYEEALSCKDIAGLVIATRPDCLEPDLIEYFKNRFGSGSPVGHPYLLIELGVESTKDETLLSVNRGHDWECAKNAILTLNEAGIDVGVHLIIGLPGETEEDFLRNADRISELPVKTLKLHQLQIIKGTAMEKQYSDHPFELLTPEKYAAVLRLFLKRLRMDIALDRFVSESPKEMVSAPSWGLKPNEFMKLLQSED